MRCIPLICFLLIACSGDSLPKEVLPPEKMQSVLYDVIRADEMVDFLKLSDSLYQPFTRRTAFYDTVFHLHGINKQTFQKSLRYYQGRPDLLKEMLEELQKKATDTTQGKRRPQIERRPQPLRVD